jgi:hypothetical protein
MGSNKFLTRFGTGLMAVALSASCAVESTDESTVEGAETAKQQLGESSTAFYFNGTGAGLIPSREERVAMHLIQRFRVAPYVFGITDMDGNPIPPAPAIQYQPFMSEAGRWQGRHALDNACFCPQDPMQQPAAWNSCCDIQEVNGEVRCVGPIVACDDETATTEEERWDLLNRGPGSIGSEFYATDTTDLDGPLPGELGAALFTNGGIGSVVNTRNSAMGISQVNNVIIPQECREPQSSCTPSGGVCVLEDGSDSCEPGSIDDNPDCIGVCDGGSTAGQNCTVPPPLDPEVCNEANYERGFYWAYSFGQTREPQPVLRDGVAYQLGLTANDDNPNGLFGVTPEGTVEFGLTYFEPSGPPRSLEAVIGNNCVDLSQWDLQDPPVFPNQNMNGPDAGNPDAGMEEIPEYVGVVYTTQATLSEPGCNRFFFAATDNEGLIHTYPSYGSLGVEVNGDGNVVFGASETCPGWSPERPSGACLAQGDQCDDGDTRPCYTGRPGAQDRGICSLGTETCDNGRWTGFCDGQVLPEADETCGNMTDDDCNGFVDENCPVTPGNNNAGNNNTGNNNAGADAGASDDAGTEPTPPGDKSSEDDGCCTTANGSTPNTPFGAVLAALIGLFLVVRRQKPSRQS